MAAKRSRIVAYSLTGAWAETSDGDLVPITDMFDEFAERTDDPEKCDRFVCGSNETKWFACWTSSFETARTQ